MGEIADMMLEGDLCACCGIFMGDWGSGHPRYCQGCRDDFPESEEPKKTANPRRKKRGKK